MTMMEQMRSLMIFSCDIGWSDVYSYEMRFLQKPIHTLNALSCILLCFLIIIGHLAILIIEKRRC